MSRTLFGLSVSIIILFQSSWSVANAASPPEIIGTDPSKLMVLGDYYSGDMPVTIYGKNLAAPDTTGYNVHEHIHIFVRDDRSADWDEVKGSTWLPTQLGIHVNKDRLAKAKTVQLKVVTKGVTSNIFSMPVLPLPTERPVLKSLNPRQIIIGGRSNDFRYLVRVSGENLHYGTRVLMGGMECAWGRKFPSDGYLDVWVPMRKPGRYSVTFANGDQRSNAQTIELANPVAPKIRGFIPREVNIPDFFIRDKNVKVEFEGAWPKSAAVRPTTPFIPGSRPRPPAPWTPVNVTNNEYGLAVVTIPAAVLEKAKPIQVKLVNEFGESTAILPVVSGPRSKSNSTEIGTPAKRIPLPVPKRDGPLPKGPIEIGTPGKRFPQPMPTSDGPLLPKGPKVPSGLLAPR